MSPPELAGGLEILPADWPKLPLFLDGAFIIRLHPTPQLCHYGGDYFLDFISSLIPSRTSVAKEGEEAPSLCVILCEIHISFHLFRIDIIHSIRIRHVGSRKRDLR